MVSVVSSFKSGGWDSFWYVVIGCSSSMNGPWLAWSAVSKEEGGIVSGI